MKRLCVFLTCFVTGLFLTLGESAFANEEEHKPMMYIWGGNRNECFQTICRMQNGDLILIAQTNSVNGTPVLSKRTRIDKKDGWILQINPIGEIISENILADDFNSTSILCAVENSEGLTIIVNEYSNDSEDSSTEKGYVIRYNTSDASVDKELLPGVPREAYVSDHGILLVGVYSVDSSQSLAWSAFVEKTGQLSWSYFSPEDYGYAQDQVRFEKCILYEGQIVLLMEKLSGETNEQYLRILDHRGDFLRDVHLSSGDVMYIQELLPTDEGIMVFGHTFSEDWIPCGIFLRIGLDGNVDFSKKIEGVNTVNVACSGQQNGSYFVENAFDGINIFRVSNDGEAYLWRKYVYDNYIDCRSVMELANGDFLCTGTLRIQTSDHMVVEKVFLLRIP